MSIASTLARTHEILILESDKEKIGKINSDRPSIDDSDIKEFYKKILLVLALSSGEGGVDRLKANINKPLILDET